MSDFNSSLPVRTETDGDVKSVIVDPTTPTQQLAIDDNGAINVRQIAGDIYEVHFTEATAADNVHKHDTKTAIAPNTPTTVVSYAVTVGKTLMLKCFGAASSGKLKIELKTGAAGSETVKVTAFTSSSDPSYDCLLAYPIEVVAGDSVIVVVTNRDMSNADLYAYINGVEV